MSFNSSSLSQPSRSFGNQSTNILHVLSDFRLCKSLVAMPSVFNRIIKKSVPNEAEERVLYYTRGFPQSGHHPLLHHSLPNAIRVTYSNIIPAFLYFIQKDFFKAYYTFVYMQGIIINEFLSNDSLSSSLVMLFKKAKKKKSYGITHGV